MKKLCIVIPTFDRPGQLLATVEALVPQLSATVGVIVSDNASQVPAAEVLAAIMRENPGRIRVERNAVNIGACPNIARLFEMSDAEWTWTLGDDDKPFTDAVETILEEIGKVSPETGYLCFGYRLATSPLGYEGFLKQLSEHGALTHVIALSAGVYRTEPAMKQLQTGYYWVNSYVPFVAMLLKMLVDGSKGAFCPTQIMLYHYVDPEQSWSRERLMMGLPTLLEIDGLPYKPLSRLVSHALDSYRYRPFIYGSLHRIFHGGGKSRGYWVLFFARMTLHMPRFRKVQSAFFFLLSGVMSFRREISPVENDRVDRG